MFINAVEVLHEKEVVKSVTDLLVRLAPDEEKIHNEWCTDYGRIDIFTKKLLIEVKRIKDYKSAIGQLIAYSMHFPKQQKLLLLFEPEGKFVKKEKLAKIYSVCRKHDIFVFVVTRTNIYTSLRDFLTKYFYPEKNTD